MLKRNATLNISLAEAQQRGRYTVFLALVDDHVNLNTFKLPDTEYRRVFFSFFLFVFLRMLMKDAGETTVCSENCEGV